MKQYELIKDYAERLELRELVEGLDGMVHQAQENKATYSEFLVSALEMDAYAKSSKDYDRRMAAARLPSRHNLDLYEPDMVTGITSQELKELRELTWMRQAYNLILSGPSGTGKTFLAAGLVADAVKAGHRAYLMTLEELMACLNLKGRSVRDRRMYKRILQASLLAIDNLMFYHLPKEEAILFLGLVDALCGKVSIIITSQRPLSEWAAGLEDEVLAAAILDRLLERSEVIRLEGESYRLGNRQTIFQHSLEKKM